MWPTIRTFSFFPSVLHSSVGDGCPSVLHSSVSDGWVLATDDDSLAVDQTDKYLSQHMQWWRKQLLWSIDQLYLMQVTFGVAIATTHTAKCKRKREYLVYLFTLLVATVGFREGWSVRITEWARTVQWHLPITVCTILMLAMVSL